MFIGFYVGDLTFGVMCVVGNDFLLMYFLCIFMYSVCLWLFFFPSEAYFITVVSI